MMATHDNAPPPDGWQVEPRPWDERKCCPATCPGVCETEQHAVFIHLPDNIILGGDAD